MPGGGASIQPASTETSLSKISALCHGFESFPVGSARWLYSTLTAHIPSLLNHNPWKLYEYCQETQIKNLQDAHNDIIKHNAEVGARNREEVLKFEQSLKAMNGNLLNLQQQPNESELDYYNRLRVLESQNLFAKYSKSNFWALTALILHTESEGLALWML